MDNSKQYLKTHKIIPRLSLNDGQPHTVKLVQDKLDQLTDQQGKVVEGVKYKVIENGELKTVFTASVTLISKLAEIEAETTVTIQQKKIKTQTGIITSYDVWKVDEQGKKQEVGTPKKEDIPIVENEDYGTEPTVPPEKQPDYDF